MLINFFFLLISFSNLGFDFDRVTSSPVLTQADLWLQFTDAYEGPAIQSVPGRVPQWESYNRWSCFRADELQLNSGRLDYWKWTNNPGFVYRDGDQIWRFEPGPEFAADENLTYEQWRRLISPGQDICLYGAFLQRLDDYESLWILTRVKSLLGEWTESNNLISWRDN